MAAISSVWSQVRQIVDTVNANGQRTENLKGAIYDLRRMKISGPNAINPETERRLAGVARVAAAVLR